MAIITSNVSQQAREDGLSWIPGKPLIQGGRKRGETSQNESFKFAENFSSGPNTTDSRESQTMGAGCEIPQKENSPDVRSSCGNPSSQRFSLQIYLWRVTQEAAEGALEIRGLHTVIN